MTKTEQEERGPTSPAPPPIPTITKIQIEDKMDRKVSTGSDWSWPTEKHADSDNPDITDNEADTVPGGFGPGSSLGLSVDQEKSRRISKLPPAEVGDLFS